jgi:hypothetical protein
MASSSSNKLTKYVSAKTIVTSDVANAWFGGLYDSAEAVSYDSLDPKVAGHAHDGEHADGHAQKINLVDHVVGKLRHTNLEDEAVFKNNVGSFTSESYAIPEYKYVEGVKYYYLDLSLLRAEILSLSSAFIEADVDAIDGYDTYEVIRQRSDDYTTSGLDFVFGSYKLDDMSDSGKGDERFFFDKSKGTFRAGSADSSQWNESNRGDYSAAFGRNNTASGIASLVSGHTNTDSSDYSVVSGKDNISSGDYSAVFGDNNSSSAVYAVVSGQENIITGNYNAVVGTKNDIGGNGVIAAGYNNYNRGNYNSIFGSDNLSKNDGAVTANSENSLIAGSLNDVRSPLSIAVGSKNTLELTAAGSAVFGTNNSVFSPDSLVFGDRAVGKVPGELVHTFGRFASNGDAQTSEFVVRGQIGNTTAPPGVVLSIDGLGSRYPMDLDDSYAIEISLIGKMIGTGEGGFYSIKSLGFGPASSPAAPASISAPIITYVFRTPYFNTPQIGANLLVAPGNLISLQVFDQHIPPNFFPTRWVATIKLTKCRY